MYKNFCIITLALCLSNSIAAYAQDDSLEFEDPSNVEQLQCTAEEIKWECDEPADPPPGEENRQDFKLDPLQEFEEELKPEQETLPEPKPEQEIPNQTTP